MATPSAALRARIADDLALAVEEAGGDVDAAIDDLLAAIALAAGFAATRRAAGRFRGRASLVGALAARLRRRSP